MVGWMGQNKNEVSLTGRHVKAGSWTRRHGNQGSFRTDKKGNWNICDDGSLVLDYIIVKFTENEWLTREIRFEVNESNPFLVVFGLQIDKSITRNGMKKVRKFKMY